eukprot:SAG22_NODE_727_length_7598_cov_89.922523_6_plen_160_part_00
MKPGDIIWFPLVLSSKTGTADYMYVIDCRTNWKLTTIIAATPTLAHSRGRMNQHPAAFTCILKIENFVKLWDASSGSDAINCGAERNIVRQQGSSSLDTCAAAGRDRPAVRVEVREAVDRALPPVVVAAQPEHRRGGDRADQPDPRLWQRNRTERRCLR